MSGPANGTAVNFGFTGTNGLTCSAINGILQNVDYSSEADKEEVKNGLGDIVARNWMDQRYKATLEFVITGATNSIAAALAATVLSGLTPGVIITISACASVPELASYNGGKWEVQPGAAIKGSNTNNKRLTVPIEARAGITAAQPA